MNLVLGQGGSLVTRMLRENWVNGRVHGRKRLLGMHCIVLIEMLLRLQSRKDVAVASAVVAIERDAIQCILVDALWIHWVVVVAVRHWRWRVQ